MKICVYGAGAIGGYLGVELARAGADVSLVARGAHLAAMRVHGLTLQIGGEERAIAPRCTDNPAELAVQDVVIICLKAHSVTGVLAQMQPLLGPRTRIVTAVNGIPYWYFTAMAGCTRIRRWKASIPADGSGASLAPNAPSAALSILRPRSSHRASSSTSTAISFRLANPPARLARTLRGSQSCSPPPA
jgi:ketopantoate reductase